MIRNRLGDNNFRYFSGAFFIIVNFQTEKSYEATKDGQEKDGEVNVVLVFRYMQRLRRYFG